MKWIWCEKCGKLKQIILETNDWFDGDLYAPRVIETCTCDSKPVGKQCVEA